MPERCSLQSQKSPCCDSKRSQLLSESVAISAVQTSIDVTQQFVQSFIKFSLVLGRLRAQQVMFVSLKARFACQH